MPFLDLQLLSAALLAAHSFPADSGRFSLFGNGWLLADSRQEGTVIFLLIDTKTQAREKKV